MIPNSNRSTGGGTDTGRFTPLFDRFTFAIFRLIPCAYLELLS